MKKSRSRAEFGDFQTPAALALEACQVIRERLGPPRAVLEPTCGRGTFLAAALEVFGAAEALRGYDLNPGHLADARERIAAHPRAARVTLIRADFFETDWNGVVDGLPSPLLVVGNPPWVTSAALGALGSANLPVKANLHGLRGLDALTGKSNFDLSEWMLLRLIAALDGRDGALAMLVKTAVARKVCEHAWRQNLPVREAALYPIDANRHFGAAVDACLFVLRSGDPEAAPRCAVFDRLQARAPTAALGLADGHLLADADAHRRSRHLLADAPVGWRSGVKHDCAKVFELRRADGEYENGLGEQIALEDTHVLPLLKSSDVKNGRLESGRYLLLPQRRIGEDTATLASTAPKTWAYLTAHADRLDARKSSIYRNRPRFSIFGVGAYTFAPWKVAISGLYKQLVFTVVPPRRDRPVLFDDTVYFLPCADEPEARARAALLGGDAAADFFRAYLFTDAKRPITTRLLNRLDLEKLSKA